MRRWLEFHDSTVVAVESRADALVFRLDAYVHQWDLVAGVWRGTGWIVPVALVLRDPGSVDEIDVPVDIWAGSLLLDQECLDNLVPLPFSGSGAVRLTIELITGLHVDVSADAVDLVAEGEGRYVEDLPADMRPFE